VGRLRWTRWHPEYVPVHYRYLIGVPPGGERIRFELETLTGRTELDAVIDRA
jgi:hypothetical protein